jgi:hypothetical protein
MAMNEDRYDDSTTAAFQIWERYQRGPNSAERYCRYVPEFIRYLIWFVTGWYVAVAWKWVWLQGEQTGAYWVYRWAHSREDVDDAG